MGLSASKRKLDSRNCKTYKAERFVYDVETKTWLVLPLTVKLDPYALPFASGAMREAFYAYEVDAGGETLCVAKVFRRDMPSEITAGEYVKEALTQSMSDEIAGKFHAQCGIKNINTLCASFLPCSVGKINAESCPPSAAFDTFFSFRIDGGFGDMYFALEPYVAGRFVKYNDNCGRLFTDWNWRLPPEEHKVCLEYFEIAEALSHFSYDESGRTLLLCDIQGIKMMLSDPQLVVVRKPGEPNNYGKGNTGKKGIDKWVSRHQCNWLCRELGLKDPKAPLPAAGEESGALTAPPSSPASCVHSREAHASHVCAEFAERCVASTSLLFRLESNAPSVRRMKSSVRKFDPCDPEFFDFDPLEASNPMGGGGGGKKIAN